MRIFGISALSHDSARRVILLPRRKVLCGFYPGEFQQEERFTRKKQDARYPEDAVRYCLDEGSLPLDELNYTFSTRSRL
jgi:carbamoyltransferase